MTNKKGTTKVREKASFDDFPFLFFRLETTICSLKLSASCSNYISIVYILHGSVHMYGNLLKMVSIFFGDGNKKIINH